MPISVAWIDGCWGSPDSLQLPLSDRGLQLADGLFETVLILDGVPQLLTEHLARWVASASLLGMDIPPTRQKLTPLIKDAINKSGLIKGSGALRLNWSRGSEQQRTISLPVSNVHRFWLTLTPCQTNFKPVTVITSQLERRNSDSLVSRCKTFAYGAAIQARREAEAAGGDDALLQNNRLELCCGTVANLLVRRDGVWITPPLNSGCLPGVMRGRALASGLVQEASLGVSLKQDDESLLINSLSCRPIRKHNGQQTRVFQGVIDLWKHLLTF
ncbi:aminotransferase class IV [Synechococcus sp. M16CYN]|uniref:aminotransferase class IV n=1 Tax=Synechococcus sp. M16CYN TaxID=3103139 RepID=UPI003245C57B